MSTPVEQAAADIAEVIAAHDFRRAKGTYASQCRCGWLWESNEAHRVHVAEAVVAALGLFEESYDSFDFGTSSRLVGPWRTA